MSRTRDIPNYIKLDVNDLKMIRNDTVYQPMKQRIIGLKGNRHKPDLKIRFWCVYIP